MGEAEATALMQQVNAAHEMLLAQLVGEGIDATVDECNE